MEDRYPSKKSPSFGYLLLIICVFVILFTIGLPLIIYGTINNSQLLVGILIETSTILLFLWFWFGTCYTIKDEILIAKSGLLKWKVPIKEINLIRLNQKTIGGTWKLTMSWNCIEIKYKKYGSIFISPENEKTFLDKLLQINNTIQIRPK